MENVENSIKFNIDKVKNIILYICNKIPSEQLGKLRLHKILWFADLFYYMQKCETITNGEYARAPKGPVFIHLDKILKQMAKDNLLKYEIKEYPRKQHLYTALSRPDISFLNGFELEILNASIIFAANNNTKFLSNATHSEVWENLKDGEIMDVGVVAVEMSISDIPYEQIDWERHGN